MISIARRIVRVATVGSLGLGAALALGGCSGEPVPADGLGIEDVSGTWILEGEYGPAAMELSADRTVKAHNWPSTVFCGGLTAPEQVEVTGTWGGATGGSNAIYLRLEGPCDIATGFLVTSSDEVLEMQFFPPEDVEFIEPSWVLRQE